MQKGFNKLTFFGFILKFTFLSFSSRTLYFILYYFAVIFSLCYYCLCCKIISVQFFALHFFLCYTVGTVGFSGWVNTCMCSPQIFKLFVTNSLFSFKGQVYDSRTVRLSGGRDLMMWTWKGTIEPGPGHVAPSQMGCKFWIYFKQITKK
jgi:hypothetical protein